MRPLEPGDFAHARALLCEGFPQRPPHFWVGALQRLQQFAGNAGTGVPLGWFLLDKGLPAGIVLTPASLRHQADGSQRCTVNLSSFYVRPAHRVRIGPMLRKVMSDVSALYTDLTATPELQQVLPTLGMAPVNAGVALHPLPPLALLPSRQARLRPLGANEPGPAAGPPRELVERHRALGCLPLVLETADAAHLVICRREQVRGVPTAQLLYAESQVLLLRHLGALARQLLRQGFVLFMRDTQQPSHTPGSIFRPRERWFVKGERLPHSTDAFASELSIIHGAAAGR